MGKDNLKTEQQCAIHDVRRSAIFNLTDGDRLKRSDKFWNKLVKELDVLQDDNYTARKLFDYVERHYA